MEHKEMRMEQNISKPITWVHTVKIKETSSYFWPKLHELSKSWMLSASGCVEEEFAQSFALWKQPCCARLSVSQWKTGSVSWGKGDHFTICTQALPGRQSASNSSKTGWKHNVFLHNKWSTSGALAERATDNKLVDIAQHSAPSNPCAYTQFF